MLPMWLHIIFHQDHNPGSLIKKRGMKEGPDLVGGGVPRVRSTMLCSHERATLEPPKHHLESQPRTSPTLRVGESRRQQAQGRVWGCFCEADISCEEGEMMRLKTAGFLFHFCSQAVGSQCSGTLGCARWLLSSVSDDRASTVQAMDVSARGREALPPSSVSSACG